MKTYILALVHILCAFILISAACSDTAKRDYKGKWHTKNNSSQLQITDKHFILTEDNTASTEDYFIKGDTIFTSFEGAQPYSKFVIDHLDDNSIKLIYPDSVLVEFVR